MKVGGGGDHGGIIAEEFFGVGDEDFEAVFFGSFAYLRTDIEIGGGSSSKENTPRFGLVDG